VRGQRALLEEGAQVVGEGVGAGVALLAVGRHRAQHDPVQLLAQQALQPRRAEPEVAGQLAGHHPRHRLDPQRRRQRLGRMGMRRAAGAARAGPLAGQQLVQQHAEGVQVRAHVERAELRVGLLRAHVVAGAGGVRRHRAGGAGDAEVDDLRQRAAVDLGDQHVAGLEVAVDDAALVGVLHAVEQLQEQVEALRQRQRAAPAVAGQRLAVDVFHDQVGRAVRQGAGVEQLGDVRVLHLCQHLALELEPGALLGRQLGGMQALDRHQALHRRDLAGTEHLAHAAAAKQGLDAEGADLLPRRQPGGILRGLRRNRLCRRIVVGDCTVVHGSRPRRGVPG
jgi:hypothetical protein